MNGKDKRHASGDVVAIAGDVNGDGFDDVLVGAHSVERDGLTFVGESYLVFGRADGFASPTTFVPEGGGFTMTGIGAGDYSGVSVSSAGDVNGDGFHDVLVGAEGADPNGLDRAGASYVVFGNDALGSTVPLSSLDGTSGFRLDGFTAEQVSGGNVSSAGDVNGDGFGDLLIGVSADIPAQLHEAYVVYGGPGPFPEAISLSDLDGSNGFRLPGLSDRFTVGQAGDVNGDGFDDLVIGALDEAFLVFGRDGGLGESQALSSLDGLTGLRISGLSGLASVGSAGDVDNDGFDDVIIAALDDKTYVIFGRAGRFPGTLDVASLDGNDGLRVTTIESDLDGPHAVSSAGDVNGDGFDDILIGASLADIDGTDDVGQTLVIFGRSGGFDANLDASLLTGSAMLRINGFADQSNSGSNKPPQSGSSVSNAGDVNGDGFDDVLIGAPYADVGYLPDAGRSYVVYGGDFTGAVTHLGTDDDDTLSGTPQAQVIIGGQGNDQSDRRRWQRRAARRPGRRRIGHQRHGLCASGGRPRYGHPAP